MDILTVCALTALALALVLGLLTYLRTTSGRGQPNKKGRGPTGTAAAPGPPRDADGNVVLAGQGPRVRRGAPAATRQRRMQVATNRSAAPPEPQPVAVADDDSGDDVDGAAGGSSGSEDTEVPLAVKAMGRKKMEKLQAKAEKKAEREAMERVRTEKRKQEEADLREADLQRQREAEAEEAERRRAEERERREHEEYLRMKAAFEVEDEGFDGSGGPDGDGGADPAKKEAEFVEYVRKTKVVPLEDLAAHFRLKAQEAIDRVTDLLARGVLTGVLDDRGKFIYVSMEELESVARFVKQRGRVSIADLAENSNKLISLQNS